MRALINGQEWNAYCESALPGLGCTKVTCRYYDDDKSFEIIAGGPPGYSVGISKGAARGGIELGINELPYRRGVVMCNTQQCLGSSSCREYDLDTTYLNILEILEINREYKIIEGKFEFRAVNRECSDTILVTDGYFRTNYLF